MGGSIKYYSIALLTNLIDINVFHVSYAILAQESETTFHSKNILCSPARLQMGDHGGVSDARSSDFLRSDTTMSTGAAEHRCNATFDPCSDTLEAVEHRSCPESDFSVPLLESPLPRVGGPPPISPSTFMDQVGIKPWDEP